MHKWWQYELQYEFFFMIFWGNKEYVGFQSCAGIVSWTVHGDHVIIIASNWIIAEEDNGTSTPVITNISTRENTLHPMREERKQNSTKMKKLIVQLQDNIGSSYNNTKQSPLTQNLLCSSLLFLLVLVFEIPY